MIMIDGKYQYKNGKTPRILCVDASGVDSVVSLCEETKATYVHHCDGTHAYGVHEWDILPIPSPPEYVPYDDSDRDEVRGKWIKSKNGNSQYQVTSFNGGTVQHMPWECAFDNWTYLDGSVFGKVKK